MMIKRFIFYILFLIAFIPVSCGAAEESRIAPAPKTEELVIVSADATRNLFNVEIADEPEEQSHGLMYRTEMAEDHGMLFVFPMVGERVFWMRNTFIPLDMVFIREDGIIHNIHPSAAPLDETPVNSVGPVKAVLELNGGTCEKLGIQAGDTVHFATFGNALGQ